MGREIESRRGIWWWLKDFVWVSLTMSADFTTILALLHSYMQGCQMVSIRTKNPKLGTFWKGLAMEDVGIFYGHLFNFPSIWQMFPRFGTFYTFWYVVPRKIWHPCIHAFSI
jgi:hypothetical protein